jgi:hypothetical protein
LTNIATTRANPSREPELNSGCVRSSARGVDRDHDRIEPGFLERHDGQRARRDGDRDHLCQVKRRHQ